MFVCTMGMGPRTNLYRIGGDRLTQLIYLKKIILALNHHHSLVTEVGKGPRTSLYNIGGDLLTQLKNLNYIFWNFFGGDLTSNFFLLQKKR